MEKENLIRIKSEMREIISLLNKWEYEYYILDNPSVNDSVYDQKLEYLKKLELDNNLILFNSPTSKMNSNIYKNSKFKLVRRENPMLSIDSVNNEKGLLNFDKKIKKDLKKATIQYLCELKIDGLSASLIYKKGILYQITTRGDGFAGEDITFNKQIICDIPFNLKKEIDCEVRGEIYMKKDSFNQINEDILKRGLKKLSNVRNAAAGTLRTLIPNKNRKVNFFAYQYFLNEIENQKNCLDYLKKDGFVIGEYKLCNEINEVFDYIKEIEKKRDKLEFSIDGIVIKLNNYEDQKALGETNKFPRWSIAYKFVSQIANSIINQISTEVSKNGRISYVAVVEPVYLDGSLIKNITLHNFAFIKKNLINIGDEVIIRKAGDVVPQIFKVIKNNFDISYWNPPKNCISCYSELIWNKNFLYQICQNKNCYERNINYLTFFASKYAMNMKGISKKIIEKLYNSELVKKPYDFYDLNEKKDKLSNIDNFKEKTVENILNSIEISRYKRLPDFISAFSIPLLSSIKAKKLTSLFNEDCNFLLDFINSKKFDLVEKEIGVKTREALDNFFLDENNHDNFKNSFKKMIFINQ